MAQAGFTPIQLYYSTTASAAPSSGNLANGELALNITDGKLYYKDNGGVVQVLATKAGASGDVVGPGSSTDNALVRFDGTALGLAQRVEDTADHRRFRVGLIGVHGPLRPRVRPQVEHVEEQAGVLLHLRHGH